MPGTVAEIRVSPGDEVAEHDPVVVLESMKLFLTLKAPRTGRVATVGVTPGQVVNSGTVMLTFEVEPPAG